MRIYIRGAGDIATGIALRLYRCGFQVVMADLPVPTAIRRTVCFSEAIRYGRAEVEGVKAVYAPDARSAQQRMQEGNIAVVVDPKMEMLTELSPDALVDAILAKRNLGTKITAAPIVVCVGPGFTAGEDCHAVIETMRGHTLGRAFYTGSTRPNTGVPGNIAGYTSERVMRAPCAGIFHPLHEIGDLVEAGETVALVDGVPMRSMISGMIRGLLPEGAVVPEGMKSGDVDPRGAQADFHHASDKALAIGGGVLEAILFLREKAAAAAAQVQAEEKEPSGHKSAWDVSGTASEIEAEVRTGTASGTSVKLTKLTECSGCGAKVGAGELVKLLSDLPVRRDEKLLVGYDRSDDASVYQIAEDMALVQTVDFFPPVVDDPYVFGAVAAANALSDIYAMGGEPKLALNVMAVPEDMPGEIVQQILRGGYAKVYEAGAMITGGHSIYDPEPKYGMAVTGFVDPRKMLTNAGAQEGDVLIYTKPLGIGAVVTAGKAELLNDAQLEAVQTAMMTLNRYARDVMVQYDCHACTDVTGFAVLGHLLEMAQGSGTQITVDPYAFTLLDGADEFAQMGILPAALYRNRHFAEGEVDAGEVPLYMQDLLYDPQTSGGLMIAVSASDAGSMLKQMQKTEGILCASIVGRVEKWDGGKRIRLQYT